MFMRHKKDRSKFDVWTLGLLLKVVLKGKKIMMYCRLAWGPKVYCHSHSAQWKYDSGVWTPRNKRTKSKSGVQDVTLSASHFGSTSRMLHLISLFRGKKTPTNQLRHSSNSHAMGNLLGFEVLPCLKTVLGKKKMLWSSPVPRTLA